MEKKRFFFFRINDFSFMKSAVYLLFSPESATNEVIDSKEATTIGEKVEVVQKEITIVDNKKSRENKVDQDDSLSPNSQSPNFSSEKDSKETTGEDQDMASKVTKEEKENPTASEIKQPHSELNCQKSTFFDICKNTNTISF